MIVWIALLCDRHIDPDPVVFSTLTGAMAFAQEFAEDFETEGNDDYLPIYHGENEEDGVVFSQMLSDEGDGVSVIRREIDT